MLKLFCLHQWDDPKFIKIQVIFTLLALRMMIL